MIFHLMTFALVLLKLLGLISVSWFIVFLPSIAIIGFALLMVILASIGIILGVTK